MEKWYVMAAGVARRLYSKLDSLGGIIYISQIIMWFTEFQCYSEM